MASMSGGLRRVEVSEDVYEVLARTARTRDTDINGVLRYLLETPTAPAPDGDTGEDDDRDGDE